MAEEFSAANSSSTPNLWEQRHPCSLSSWHPPNPSSNFSSEEKLSILNSFANSSNHSTAVADHPSCQLNQPEYEDHLWDLFLLSAGIGGNTYNSKDFGENFLVTLLGMENCCEFMNSTSFHDLETQFNIFNGSLLEHERLTNLSNLISNWSISPLDPKVDNKNVPPTCHMSSISSMEDYSKLDLSQMKQNLFSSVIGENIKYYYGMSNVPWSNFSDPISFGGCLNKPLVDIQSSNNYLIASTSSDSEKQGHGTSFSVRGNESECKIASEGTKKTCVDSSKKLLEKPKYESSIISSVKVHDPKAKLGDRITALHKLVTPFGKRDTASVLQETIGYINFLQDQVQVLCSPYLRSNAKEDPCGGLERKDKAKAKVDLKSRGLCLVPISCTFQIYQDKCD